MNSGPAPTDSVPLPVDAVLVLRPRTHKQLHREPLCWVDETHGAAFHQHGGRYSKL